MASKKASAYALASKRRDRTGEPTRAEPPRPEDLIPAQLERRRRIVETAHALLEHHDYDDIQVRDVADHAGVALGTVYRYFASKEHLFAAVLLMWSEGLRFNLATSPLRGTTLPEQLADVYERVIDAFERRPQFFRVMTDMETTTDTYAREVTQDFNLAGRTSLAEPFRELDSDEARDISIVLMAVLSGGLRTWSTGHTPIEEVRRRVRRTVDLIFSDSPVSLPHDR